MNPAVYIRTKVFRLSQEDFAALMATSQPTVSRWERWGRIPGTKQEAVRAKAAELKLPWDNRWFFEVPENAEAA